MLVHLLVGKRIEMPGGGAVVYPAGFNSVSDELAHEWFAAGDAYPDAAGDRCQAAHVDGKRTCTLLVSHEKDHFDVEGGRWSPEIEKQKYSEPPPQPEQPAPADEPAPTRKKKGKE